MALVSGSLVIIPIILAVIFLGLTFLFLRRLRLGAEEYGNDTMPRNTFLLEMILQLRSLQYLNLRNLWCARYRESSAEQVCARLRTARLLGIEAALSDFLMAAGGMFLMTFAALRIMDGTLQGGDLFVLVLLLWRVITPLRMLLSATSQWQQLFYHLQHVKRLQKLPNETVSFHKDQLVVKNVEVLSVQNLTFRYPDALLPALSNISFTIPAGSLVGVAGQSNAGKSTLCRLLLGLYAPQVGSIFVGEQDVRQFSEMHLRQLIAYVGEVPEIFEGTVADNLRLTAPWASDSELQEAATQMACWEMITALPAGLQAPLTPTYFDTFSGSFLQRLCLTRAYLQKAPFLILDMAISQLDGHGERAFLQVLQRLRGNTTVFIVTHRRPQLALMDWILVFDAGKLVRQGPASEIVPSTAQRPKESA
ncbi:MAG: hypothetical protein A3J38_09230 [Gammaproteobacteria bacterium RIFCSPHIGHO2_12_FULL_45_9]|nr:MAG: hypothetical protein A3J38_09230 [Gammaproteobacteria bacterium RIFCSPHIGHO2_12_FULL_45_9]